VSEYDLVCDHCGRPLEPDAGVLLWREDAQARRESGFAVCHTTCEVGDANKRLELRPLTWPNGYLAFFGERYARLDEGWSIDDAARLQSLLHALAPFVMRHDTAAEMDSMRAASFGQRVGVKPGAKAPSAEVEAGK
jgi:hypothetical protein